MLLSCFTDQITAHNSNIARDYVPLVERLRNHPRTNVQHLAELFSATRTGVAVSTLARKGGFVDSATYLSSSKTVTISASDQQQLRNVLEIDGGEPPAEWRQVASLTIGGVVRVPESQKKLTSRTRSHFFQQRSTNKYGTILNIYNISSHRAYVARVRLFAASNPAFARRSRLPQVTQSRFHEELLVCEDVGDLVVMATPRGKTNASRQRVILPNFRGYGGE